MLNDLNNIRSALEIICERYETTAPTVHAWANDLYVRINERPDDVRLSELLTVGRFVEGGVWLQPNYAANMVYKLQARLGQDTTGHAGF